MKLRIKGASLRLRLTQGEIRALGEQGMIEERVPFAHAQLVYRLKREAVAHEIGASFRDGVVEIQIPEGAARQWCTTPLVTLEREQPVPGGTLRIVLEKDYACLAPRSDEDESDNYPHPDGASGKTC
jgi:hypothetical protein